MMKMLYLECGMGAAGDMLAAALLDLYEDPEAMVGRLNALHLEGISYALERGHSCGVAAMRLHVLCHGEEEHAHEHGHEHGHEHEHGHGHAHHAHRHLSDIESMVDGMAVSARVRENIKQVYRRIAEAEGHAHGCEVGEVHFHEVGMLDAVGDVTAVCVMMDDLGIDRVMASPVHVGAGVVRCAHGTLPVPAPATAWILRDVPTYGGEIASELCTPTGAALIRHFAEGFGPQPVMRVARVGYGMGQKVFERMNCVRAFLGWADDGQDRDGVVYEMSCNLDDMTAERMGYAAERVMEAGALDVWTVPAVMKKGRPGAVFSCLCTGARHDAVLRAIFAHTTTIGVREVETSRHVLARHFVTRQTPWGEVGIKIASGYGVERAKPEFEDIARMAGALGVSIEEVMRRLGMEDWRTSEDACRPYPIDKGIVPDL